MNTSPSLARNYRWLGYLAIGHVVAVFGLGLLLLWGGISLEKPWPLRLWVALATLSFLWPIVLALHRGRSRLRFALFVSLTAILLLPSLRFYDMFAPEVLGLPLGVSLNPVSIRNYYTAYRAGRAEAKKDIAAGILAVEEYGLPSPGAYHYAQMVRERYHIEVRRVAGCIVDEKILAHAAGYNEVSESEIDRRVGRDRVDAAREEAAKLAAEQRAREEQYFKDLVKRFSTFTPDSKIALESVRLWTDGQREIAPESEEELGQFIRLMEKFITERIPADAPPFELHVSATLTPAESPKFETSANLGASQEVYFRIYNDLQNLTVPRWNEGRLTVALNFRIRATR